MPKINYAAYKNPETLAVLLRWFEQTYGTTASKEDGYLTIQDLYQSYCEYTIDPLYVSQRLNINEFAKCVVACRILDIGGQFVHRPSYQPAPSAITRATV